MKNIKIIAIDVDGTLLNSKKELTLKVKNTILKAKRAGIKIVIATGRPLSGVEKILTELGLNDQEDQYVVCFGDKEGDHSDFRDFEDDSVDVKELKEKLPIDLQKAVKDNGRSIYDYLKLNNVYKKKKI